MAEGKEKFTVDTQGLDEMLGNWREEIKGKQRGLFNFETIVDLKLKELKEKIYKEISPADNWVMRQCYYKDVDKYDYIDEDWKPIKVGETWGGEDVSCFFKQTIRIPESMKGERIALMLYLGGDSLVSVNGVPYQGLDPMRNIVILTDKAEGNEVYDLSVESYYMWHAGESEIKKIECSCIASIDKEIEKAYWDYKAAFKGLTIVNIEDNLAHYLKDVLKEAIRYIGPDLNDRESLVENLKIGQQILQDKIYNSDKFRIDGKLDLIGNSHLDLVFLWPFREFVRKLGRTHATMLRLMEQYPKFIFSQSQPAMYKEMKKNFPEIYRQVKERVKEGRWEVIGGMWVEPDCNLISGESFTRQLLMGTSFIQKEFGITPRTCWLPDVFGNAYTMPQILKKSGIEYFVTHKMGVWNDTNPWKNHTFIWEGPDGSKVLAIQPPTHFIGTMEPDHLSLNWSRFSDKQNVGESFFCYGWGDGGGGVDSEMLEYVDRYTKFPGLPETETIKVEDAFDRIKANAKNLPVWRDELYLEAHRGVHTTKGRLKKLNRYSENLYREAEIYSSIAMTMGLEYPMDKLNEGWEKILTNQFHDSLPGSHINPVYYDLLKEYEAIVKIGEEIKEKALSFITNNVELSEKSSNMKPIIIHNSLPFVNSRLAYIDVKENIIIRDEDGNIVEHQIIDKLDGSRKIVFYAKNIPAVGYKTYYIETSTKSAEYTNNFKLSSEAMENDFYEIKFNAAGEITSIYDKKSKREVIAENGKGNVFRIYEDIPSKYEAWDIVETYLDKEFTVEPGTIEVFENGPVCCSVILKKKFFESTLKQKIVIYKDVPRIDFETEIDWKERKKLLKAGFDVDIVAKEYTSDIAYGNIQRPAHRNTSFDKAKFEVSAHNWIDMSEEGYGVSILNDCKYGYDVKENRMTVTLLKGPTNPDPLSDIEVHYFTYSIFPHEGNWKQGGTNEKGLEFNNPLNIIEVDSYKNTGNLPSENSFISISDKNVTLEAVKKAEVSEHIVVRVVERFGKRTTTKLKVLNGISSAVESDLMENDVCEHKVKDGMLEFTINPYEIKTFKLKLN